jgi:hypothetical protein
MKLIKSRVQNSVTDPDAVSIAKEMVNIYHGTEYYDTETGQEIPDATPDYLKWTVGEMDYEYCPARCAIYVDSSIHGKTLETFRQKIVTEFHRYNKWGDRTSIYKNHVGMESNQFTYETAPVPCGQWVMAPGKPNHAKYSEYPFSFIMSDEISIVQFAHPLKHPKSHDMMTFATAIVFDLKWSIPVEEHMQYLNYPPATNNVTFIKQSIILCQYTGIDRVLIGRQYPAQYLKSELEQLAPFEPHPDQTFYADLAMTRKVEADQVIEHCATCTQRLFGRYYVIEAKNTNKHIAICKFCMHFDYLTNKTIRDTKNDITAYIANAPDAVRVELIAKHPQCRLLETLDVAIRADDVKFIPPNKLDEHHLHNCREAIAFSNYIGVQAFGAELQIASCLNNIEKYPQDTIIFHYTL